MAAGAGLEQPLAVVEAVMLLCVGRNGAVAARTDAIKGAGFLFHRFTSFVLLPRYFWQSSRTRRLGVGVV